MRQRHALLVGHLATGKNLKRQGVATDLLLWSIEAAARMSERIGCRSVMPNPLGDPKTMEFYPHLGFRHMPASNGEDDVFCIDIQDKIEAGTPLSLPGGAADARPA